MAATSPEPAGGQAPMLRPFDELRRYTIGAADGDVGEVIDAYFDDASWTVRHLVVDTGRWLPGRQVLISPCVVTAVDAAGQRLVTNLTREQIKDAPGAERAWPVSRQRERELAVYYAYPYYWAGPYRWGPTPYPMAGSAVDAPTEPPPHAERARDEPSLRSVREVLGYAITATDGDLGHVEDMLVDEASWAIRYLIVDPRSWWPGPHVIIPVDWIVGVSWSERAVRVDVTRDAVRNAPEYVAPDDAPPADDVGVGSYRSGVSRAYEERLYQHYGRPGYWARDPRFWLLMPPAA